MLAFAAPALGQTSRGYAREGVYVGLAGALDFTFDGDSFDGLTFYEAETGNEIFILPRLDEQMLRRLAVGFRSRTLALEFSYDRTVHDGEFAGFTTPATFNAVNADAKFFFLTEGRVQPHALVGISFPWLIVTDGSATPTLEGDASFRGQGLNLEGGITVYATPRVGASLGYAYRVIWFNRVRGVTDERFDLRPRFRETSGSLQLMGFFTF
jgi:hypothetical protein